MHEHDDVAALGVRHDERDVAVKERRLASEGEGFAGERHG